MIAWYNPRSWLRRNPSLAERNAMLREELIAQYEARHLARAKNILEAWGDEVPVWDVADLYRQGLDVIPYSTPQDRRYGQKWPLVRNENDLDRVRQNSRILCDINNHAKGFLAGLGCYVIGKGFSYQWGLKSQTDKKGTNAAAPTDEEAKLIALVQEWQDAFILRNKWRAREKELFRRRRRDGEFFLRLINIDGVTYVRFVEPEQVRQPPGSPLDEWAFGIKTDREDVEKIEAYAVWYKSEPGEEIVPAKKIVHSKANVDSTVKRGVPDFAYDAADCLQGASKLIYHLYEAGAVQAAIALIRQHETASRTAVQSYVDATIDVTKKVPGTTRDAPVSRVKPGATHDIPKGLQYVPPPGMTAGETHMQIAQMTLRSVSVIWNAPEWLGSADASNNNYASGLVAEAPFVKRCEDEQEVLIEVFTDVMHRARDNAIEAQLLPPEAKQLHLQVEAPPVQVRDPLQLAQVLETERRNGVTSPQTWQQIVGRDPDQEQINFDEWKEKNGPLPGEEGLPGMGAAGGGPGGGGEGGGQQKPPTLEDLFKGEWRREGDWNEKDHPRSKTGQFGSKNTPAKQKADKEIGDSATQLATNVARNFHPTDSSPNDVGHEIQQRMRKYPDDVQSAFKARYGITDKDSPREMGRKFMDKYKGDDWSKDPDIAKGSGDAKVDKRVGDIASHVMKHTAADAEPKDVGAGIQKLMDKQPAKVQQAFNEKYGIKDGDDTETIGKKFMDKHMKDKDKDKDKEPDKPVEMGGVLRAATDAFFRLLSFLRPF